MQRDRLIQRLEKIRSAGGGAWSIQQLPDHILAWEYYYRDLILKARERLQPQQELK
jgi:hypothetical protein